MQYLITWLAFSAALYVCAYFTGKEYRISFDGAYWSGFYASACFIQSCIEI